MDSKIPINDFSYNYEVAIFITEVFVVQCSHNRYQISGTKWMRTRMRGDSQTSVCL